MKTKKFQITFAIEVGEEELKGLDSSGILEKVVTMVEETWDAGQEARKADQPTASLVHDSYGFEVEQIDG